MKVKKVVIGVLFGVIISVNISLNAYAQNIVLLNEKFDSELTDWYCTDRCYSTLNALNKYETGKFENMKVNNGIMQIKDKYAVKPFSSEKEGIIEFSFRAKSADDDNFFRAEILSDTGYLISGVYENSSRVFINHPYGDAAVSGKLIQKLQRNDNAFHRYKLYVDFDNNKSYIEVDGVMSDSISLPNDQRPARIVFKDILVDEFSVKRIYTFQVFQNDIQVDNMFDESELVCNVEQNIPDGSMLIAAAFDNNRKLKNVYTSETKTVNIEGNFKNSYVKCFLIDKKTLSPLFSRAQIFKPIGTDNLFFASKLLEFKKNNVNTSYDFSTLSKDSMTFFDELSENDKIEIYETEKQDDTDKIYNSVYEHDIHRDSSWHSEGDFSQKTEQMLDRMFELSGTKFDNGYAIGITENPLYYMLCGDITTANEKILSREDYPFTDMQHYYLYFKYNDKLSEEAKTKLKRVIYNDCFHQTQGFSYTVGKISPISNVNHNQAYDGLVRGIMYAQCFTDEEIIDSGLMPELLPSEMKLEMNNVLDKLIAGTALKGTAIGDFNSPCYGAMIWADLITLSDLVTDADMKVKVDLLLNRCEAEAATLFHKETSNTVGPYARSGYGLAAGVETRQSFPILFHRLSDENVFYRQDDTTGYSFWYANMAGFTHQMPKYIQNIAFKKEYPYNVNIFSLRNSTDEEYTIDAGVQHEHENSKKKISDMTGYMTDSYSMGLSPDTAWYIPGSRGQDSQFLLRWNNADNVDSLRDTTTLMSYYRYNSDCSLDNSNSVNVFSTLYVDEVDAAGNTIRKESSTLYTPNEHGLSAGVQYNNKAIVYSYPGKVENDKYYNSDKIRMKDYILPNVYDMGTAIYLTNPENLDIWFEDELVCSECVITEKNDNQLRAKLCNLPYNMEKEGNVYIEDKNIYVAIIPLNTTKTSQSLFGQIRDVTNDVGENSIIVPAYSLNFYNYHSETPISPTVDERQQQRNGYIIEVATKEEYSSIEEFKTYIRKSSHSVSEMGNIWKTEYKSGDDTISISFDTNNLYVTERMINGVKQTDDFYMVYQDGETIYPIESTNGYYDWMQSDIYKKNPVMYSSPNLIQSMKKEIKIGDSTISNLDGAMIYVIYDSISKTYVLGDMTPGENDYIITTPYGVVTIDSLDIGTLTFNGETKQIQISKKEDNINLRCEVSE